MTQINKNNSIPTARKSEKYPFDDLKVTDSFTVDEEYSKELARQMGSLIGYYNRTRGEKRFRQVKKDNKIEVYREK